MLGLYAVAFGAYLAALLGGAVACAASLAALVAYAATHIRVQLGVLGGLLATAAIGEAIIRARRPSAARARRGDSAGRGS